MADQPEEINVERIFATTIEAAWQAITDPVQMRQWYFKEIADFKPVVGFETRFDVHVENRVFPHIWKVTEVDEGRHVAYSWQFGGYQGEAVSYWTLEEVLGGVKLTFVHSGLDSFPREDPIFSREAGEQGWDYFINQQLSSFLE